MAAARASPEPGPRARRGPPSHRVSDRLHPTVLHIVLILLPHLNEWNMIVTFGKHQGRRRQDHARPEPRHRAGQVRTGRLADRRRPAGHRPGGHRVARRGRTETGHRLRHPIRPAPTLRSQVLHQGGRFDDTIIDAGGRDSTALRARPDPVRRPARAVPPAQLRRLGTRRHGRARRGGPRRTGRTQGQGRPELRRPPASGPRTTARPRRPAATCRCSSTCQPRCAAARHSPTRPAPGSRCWRSHRRTVRRSQS